MGVASENATGRLVIPIVPREAEDDKGDRSGFTTSRPATAPGRLGQAFGWSKPRLAVSGRSPDPDAPPGRSVSGRSGGTEAVTQRE